jgi:hypothetical protein
MSQNRSPALIVFQQTILIHVLFIPTISLRLLRQILGNIRPTQPAPTTCIKPSRNPMRPALLQHMAFLQRIPVPKALGLVIAQVCVDRDIDFDEAGFGLET